MAVALVVGAVVLAGAASHSTSAARAGGSTAGSRGACAPFAVIDSRGSGERAGTLGPPGAAFISLFEARERGRRVAVSVNPYPAVAITLSDLSGDGSRSYKASVASGQRDLLRLVVLVRSHCPSTRVILTGYSQGAQVAGNVYQALSPALRAGVLALVLFGDPSFNAGDGAVDRGTFARLSGVFGARPRFVVARGSTVLSYCNRYDPICQHPLPLLDYVRYGFSQHLDYPARPYERAAASYVSGLAAR
jgi:hypothetical protein